MQRLVLEAAWEKTIARDDRQRITAAFEQANERQTDSRMFLPLWQTRNHRGDLLVTVIVQNFAETALDLDHIVLAYYEVGQQVAIHPFAHRTITIRPKCSMPWTFIFPKNAIMREPCLEGGYVSLVDEER